MHSSAYCPLDSLLDLACRDGVDIRPTLLRVLTDLYVQKHSHTADEETQYVELAVGLIDAVDAATRAVVTARLRAYPSAPAAVLQKLVQTRMDVYCRPEAAALTSSRSAPRSAHAPQDDERESTIPQPGIAPTANPSHPPSPTAAAAIAARQDLIELFFSASAGERRLILTNLDVPVEHYAHAAMPPPADVARRLESAALQRNRAEFGRVLEWGLGIARPIAERIASDSSGEAIVVAAKAIRMKADVLQRILLFLNPVIGHSVKRVFELAQLYDDMSQAAAARMLMIWRGASHRSRPVHVPQYVDDQTARTRPRTSSAPHSDVRPGVTRALPHRANRNGQS